MPATSLAPCDWPLTALDDCQALTDLGAGTAGDTLRDAVKAMAVAHLWNWTGKLYGLCAVEVRPCREDCASSGTTYQGRAGVPSSGGVGFRPVLLDGSWLNIGCGSCGDACSCSSLSSIRLPGPVAAVDKVTIDGEEIPEEGYVLDGSRLIRVGGSWPVCQHLDRTPGEEGTWSIAYQRGVPVPEGGRLAAAVLACEMAKYLTGDKGCQLPRRVSSISREGVTVAAILDTFDDLDAGRTGIYLVDSWVASVTKAPRRSRVFSPDLPRTRLWRRS